MNGASTLCLGVVLLSLAVPARAAIEVVFIEDAPKDRFVITNTGECAAESFQLVIDLGPSAGGLYFDTTGAGAGVQVFQPFEAVAGVVRLVSTHGAQAVVADGQKALTVEVAHLAAGAAAEFTIDVDDTVVNGTLGQSRVAAAEIAGARIQLARADEAPLEAKFDSSARAVTPALPCPTAVR